ncbi:TonB-dependent receptor [Geomonas sp. RF6]|uniref:TonB-dependent receptor plug domain-containing protein n=1 Tax=Geomonas sp. RF6 TaxID=2897342 RepID=UPI001E5CF1F8|nr:TonB-dependent receptor [Geomonas sp. RF6]UFS71934.1 TonB-dependent receptor [Geomonas sp. RF6]
MGSSDADTIATGRFSRPVSRTAENVSVISAEEIEAHNAHTVSDILKLIPGIQVDLQTGPASVVSITVQGADYNHVLVLFDGIPWNNLMSNFPDLGLIPARIVERIEVSKGAASSSWGPALGGIINIVTKSPEPDRKLSGTISASHGEHNTNDDSGEISGTAGNFGYYLSGGYFGTGGFQPNTNERLRNAYQKLSYEFPGGGRALFSFGYTEVNRGNFAIDQPDITAKEDSWGRRLTFVLSATKPLTEYLDLQLTARHSSNDNRISSEATLPVLYPDTVFRSTLDWDEKISGGSVQLLLHTSNNTLVAGVDLDKDSVSFLRDGERVDKGENRWGFYLNDSFAFGPFSISPGIRYDITGNAGNQWSPSFGATWQVNEQTTVRSYVAKGYSLPSLALDSVEKVWTAQVGVETSAIPHLWLKATLFHNELDALLDDLSTQHQVKEGVETEVRTAPFFHTSFFLGYTFIDARRTSDDSVIPNRPRHLLLLGARYDDGRILDVAVTGRMADLQSDLNGRYGAMVWDGTLTATPWGRGDLMPHFFVTLHNVFDGDQYLTDQFKNPRRWLEGGVRWRF